MFLAFFPHFFPHFPGEMWGSRVSFPRHFCRRSESLEWLNDLVLRLWPKIDLAVQKIIHDQVWSGVEWMGWFLLWIWGVDMLGGWLVNDVFLIVFTFSCFFLWVILFGWFGRGRFCETVVLGGWVVSGKWRNGGLKIFSCPMDCQVTPQLQESLPGPFKGAAGKRERSIVSLLGTMDCQLWVGQNWRWITDDFGSFWYEWYSYD